MLITNNTATFYYLGSSEYPLPPNESITISDDIYNYVDKVAKAIHALDDSGYVTVSSAPTGYPRRFSDAIGISFAPYGTVAAIDVQTAIEEVATEASQGGGTGQFEYRADTTVGPSDPGSGDIRWNNATQDSATVLSFSNLSRDGIDVSLIFLHRIATGTHLFIQHDDDSSAWQQWEVVSSTDQGAYFDVTVTLINSWGQNFANNQKLMVWLHEHATGGGVELALATFTNTEIVLGTDTNIVSAPSVSLDGSTDIEVVFYAPLVAGNSMIYLELFYAKNGGADTSVGYIYSSAQFSGYGSNPAVFIGYPFVGDTRLTSGAYVFKVKGTSAGGSVYAGVGGADTRVPGYIRVRSI